METREMANDSQRSGSRKNRDGSSAPGGKSDVGKQGQGGESSRNDQGQSGSAQQEQGGNVSHQGGATGRNRDEERVGDDTQSGSSPRSRSDAPDEGKVGRS
jgi:hypothetical protein